MTTSTLPTRSEFQDDRVRVAKEYAAKGWHVFPVCWPDDDGNCACPGQWVKALKKHIAHTGRNVGKAPIIPQWQNRPDTKSTTTAQGVDAFVEQFPGCNWGGWYPDMIGIDVDRDSGGYDSLNKLQAKYGQLPPTLTHQTGGGGLHIFYADKKGRDIRNTTEMAGYPGLDRRGNGGQVLLPGSKHRSGDMYSVYRDLPIAVVPDWLAEIDAVSSGDQNGENVKAESNHHIPRGQQDEWLTRRAWGYAGKGDSEKAIAGKLKIDVGERFVEQDSGDPWTDQHIEDKAQRAFERYKVKSDGHRDGIGNKGHEDAGNSQVKPSKPTRKNRKGPHSEDVEIRQTSFAAVGDKLYEQIVKDGRSALVEYDAKTNEISIVDHLMQDDARVIPLAGEEISLGAVRLPSGVVEYGSTTTLLNEIESHIYHYLDVSDSFRKFASYYILLSWVYDRFNTLPYLRAIGDTGCGKSRLLDVCGGLCYKATSASGCITPAPIYRMLKRWSGTMILDEADLQNGDEYHEVVKILNCGFERNRPVIRAVKDNPDKIQILPTFGPKVFATRRRFKDAALEARCLTEIMNETARTDIPATLTAPFYKEQEELRNKLLLFRLRNFQAIQPEQSVTLDLQGIEPRLKQISACFASLFAGQPEVLRDYQTFISQHQRELVEQRAATTVGQIVSKLFELIESATIVTNVTNVTLIPISAGDIAEKLNMTPQTVGQILKTLGLQTSLYKVGGKAKRCLIENK